MSEDRIATFVARLMNDDDLRARFRDSPKAVLEEFGIELTPEEEKRLAREDWAGVPDHALIDRLGGGGLRTMF